MPDYPIGRERGIGCTQCEDEFRQHAVLNRLVCHVIGPLELDAYRKVVTALAAPVVRGARMPGPAVEGNILNLCAVAANQQVRRDFEAGDFPKIGMDLGRQRIRK